MSNLKPSNRLDEKYAPPLASEHVTPHKLKKLKVALWIAYTGLPLSLIGFLCMLILDDNHPVAESIPVALSFILTFVIALGAFVYVAFSPIYRRLMNRILELDEGELYLQHQAYSFAYGIIFKGGVFLMLACVLISQIFTLSLVPLKFPQINGGGVVLAAVLTVIFLQVLIMMLPMIYLVWNLKPVGEED